MKTSKENLQQLKEKKDKAVLEYNKYLKQYNEERKIERGHTVKEIISLHKQGFTNQEIIDKGYNKNYVNQQVTFFKKGKRVARTQVAQFLSPKKKKKVS